MPLTGVTSRRALLVRQVPQVMLGTLHAVEQLLASLQFELVGDRAPCQWCRLAAFCETRLPSRGAARVDAVSDWLKERVAW